MVLGTRDISMDRTDKVPLSQSLYSIQRDRE